MLRLLHQAALWDNGELLEDLLNGEELGCLNARDSWGRTALHAAATNHNSQCLRILCQAGADLDATCGPRGQGRTPLHVAAEHGHETNVQVLVENGAKLTLRDHLGLLPLDLAEKCEHNGCMGVLRAAAQRQETLRLHTFNLLGQACSQGDLATVKAQAMEPEMVNFTPAGSHSLLYKAAENGHKEVVSHLLAAGAEAGAHPVTKYSPLHAACSGGKRDVVEILLRAKPEAVRNLTIEKWSPLHAACLGGHLAVAELLLKYPYPKETMQTFRGQNGKLEFQAPFDINQRDAAGQTVLCLACKSGILKLVELFLNFKVRARKVCKSGSKDDSLLATPKRSGIQSLLAKLRGSEEPLASDEQFYSPLELDLYSGTDTALHLAVKAKEHAITHRLLAAGANPNLAIYVETSTNSTSLMEACKNRDMGMIDLLLKYGAKDDDCKALAAVSGDELIMSKLLALKANQDPENGINRAGVSELNQGGFVLASVSSSVMINWHQQGCLTQIKDQWLIDAAVRLNPKLRLSPKSQQIAVHAITRLDVSNNDLTVIPSVVFQMQSLKFLCLSQNKLEVLPKSRHYHCPWLEELQMQDNRLEVLPPALFNLRSLTTLDVSNNKLQTLPVEMWSAPKLKELNVAFNLLSELPVQIASESADADTTSCDSDTVSESCSFSESDTKSLFEERSLQRHELKHHSLWSTNIQIQDKSLPDPQINSNGGLERTNTLRRRRIQNGQSNKVQWKSLNVLRQPISQAIFYTSTLLKLPPCQEKS